MGRVGGPCSPERAEIYLDRGDPFTLVQPLLSHRGLILPHKVALIPVVPLMVAAPP